MLLALFYIFLAYLLYNLVFKLIIPIYRTTKQVRKGFREMQEKMNGQAAGGGQTPKNNSSSTPKNSKVGDYIDFEEVRD